MFRVCCLFLLFVLLCVCFGFNIVVCNVVCVFCLCVCVVVEALLLRCCLFGCVCFLLLS